MKYNMPPIELLTKNEEKGIFQDREYQKYLAERLDSTLRSLGIAVNIVEVHATKLSCVFDIILNLGVSVKKIKEVQKDIELAFACPIEIFVHEDRVKIAVKTLGRPLIRIRDIIETEEFKDKDAKLNMAVGIDLMGNPYVYDLVKTPHMLIAGCTGSGKTTFIDDIIVSLLYNNTPEDVRFLMVDPKFTVELQMYNGLPHMLSDVVYSLDDSLELLHWLEDEMGRRYQKMEQAHVKDIEEYNKALGTTKMYRIVFIIDEYMDFVDPKKGAPKEFNTVVERIARLGRAAGLHLIIATQRVVKKVVTPQIKANIPCRAAFVAVDGRESRTILDRTGAERLLGNGDMIFAVTEEMVPIHLQAPFVDEREVRKVVQYIKENNRNYN